jgi:transposase
MDIDRGHGFSRPDANGIPLTPWDITEDYLLKNDMETMSGLFRNYKEAFNIAYSPLIEAFELTEDIRIKKIEEQRNKAKERQYQRQKDISEGKYTEKQKNLLKPIQVNFPPGSIRRKKTPKHPKGMTYASFTKYVNKWLREGLVERVIEDGKVLRGDFIFVDESQKLQRPVYYKLKGT